MLSAEVRELGIGEEGMQISRNRRGLQSRRGGRRRARWEVQPLTRAGAELSRAWSAGRGVYSLSQGLSRTDKMGCSDVPLSGSSPTVCPEYISKSLFQGLLWEPKGKGNSTNKAANISSYKIPVQQK